MDDNKEENKDNGRDGSNESLNHLVGTVLQMLLSYLGTLTDWEQFASNPNLPEGFLSIINQAQSLEIPQNLENICSTLEDFLSNAHDNDMEGLSCFNAAENGNDIMGTNHRSIYVMEQDTLEHIISHAVGSENDENSEQMDTIDSTGPVEEFRLADLVSTMEDTPSITNILGIKAAVLPLEITAEFEAVQPDEDSDDSGSEVDHDLIIQTGRHMFARSLLEDPDFDYMEAARFLQQLENPAANNDNVQEDTPDDVDDDVNDG